MLKEGRKEGSRPFGRKAWMKGRACGGERSLETQPAEYKWDVTYLMEGCRYSNQSFCLALESRFLLAFLADGREVVARWLRPGA
jgi:hypothetical protein